MCIIAMKKLGWWSGFYHILPFTGGKKTKNISQLAEYIPFTKQALWDGIPWLNTYLGCIKPYK